MKLSQLRQLIKEEIRGVLNETNILHGTYPFTALGSQPEQKYTTEDTKLKSLVSSFFRANPESTTEEFMDLLKNYPEYWTRNPERANLESKKEDILQYIKDFENRFKQSSYPGLGGGGRRPPEHSYAGAGDKGTYDYDSPKRSNYVGRIAGAGKRR